MRSFQGRWYQKRLLYDYLLVVKWVEEGGSVVIFGGDKLDKHVVSQEIVEEVLLVVKAVVKKRIANFIVGWEDKLPYEVL